MKPKQLSFFFGFPSYGGNGGIQSEVPDIREWWADTVLFCRDDPRIEKFVSRTIGDTPITMVRNEFVTLARQQGCDVLVMIDSDQHPGRHKKEPDFKPFLESSFDFLYDHYDKGPVVIGAPYCGPPNGIENGYVFYWENSGDRGFESQPRLEQYTRRDMASLRGIQEVGALPTGLIMYDMRAFELIEPSSLSKDQVLDQLLAGKMTKQQAKRALHEGWFYYEWADNTASKKGSTEDVTNTRDISLCGIQTLGYNPVFCNFDSPIGHWKPWCVAGRPELYRADSVSATLADAALSGLGTNEAIIDLDEQNKDLFPTPRFSVNGHEPEFPQEVLDLVPEEHRDKLGVRDLYGHTTYYFGHQTDKRHLDALGKLCREEGVKRAVEVGSWTGDSAIAMIKHGVKGVNCVDTWQGNKADWLGDLSKECDVKGLFDYNVKGLRAWDWISPSLHAARMSADEKKFWDLIFIDAEHSYVAVKEDILAWLPCVKMGGIMIGHDYKVQAFPGVERAVDDIFGPAVETYADYPECGAFWMVRVNEEVRDHVRSFIAATS